MTEAEDVAGLPIAIVERDCGLSKDTLRVWERRYGFPTPSRDHRGERRYAAEQVAALRLLRGLLDRGYRPGRIVGRPLEEIAALARGFEPEPGFSVHAEAALALLKAHRPEALGAQLLAWLMSNGVPYFACRIAPELIAAIGVAWSRGEISIHEEHVFTDQLSGVLRGAIGAAKGAAQDRPSVLLTTLPGEAHGLGLLLAECVLTDSRCRCISLGVQTPIHEIVSAVEAYGVDILALSFSSFFSAADAADGVDALRRRLEAPTRIWVGGSCSGFRVAPGVTVVRDLSAIAEALSDWRRGEGG